MSEDADDNIADGRCTNNMYLPLAPPPSSPCHTAERGSAPQIPCSLTATRITRPARPSSELRGLARRCGNVPLRRMPVAAGLPLAPPLPPLLSLLVELLPCRASAAACVLPRAGKERCRGPAAGAAPAAPRRDCCCCTNDDDGGRTDDELDTAEGRWDSEAVTETVGGAFRGGSAVARHGVAVDGVRGGCGDATASAVVVRAVVGAAAGTTTCGGVLLTLPVPVAAAAGARAVRFRAAPVAAPEA